MNSRNALIIWIIALALWAFHHWEPASGAHQVEQDADALITDARQAVDQHVRLYKVLPDRVPATVIGDLVTITVIDAAANPPVYALKASIGDVTKQWQGPVTP